MGQGLGKSTEARKSRRAEKTRREAGTYEIIGAAKNIANHLLFFVIYGKLISAPDLVNTKMVKLDEFNLTMGKGVNFQWSSPQWRKLVYLACEGEGTGYGQLASF